MANNNILSQEEIEALSKQEKSNTKDSPINVCARITYGFDTNIVSMDLDSPLNKQSYQKAMEINPHWEDFQIPVGYMIHNISTEEIKDVAVPVYELNNATGKYEGKIVKKTMFPNDKLILPTEFVMILLMQLGCGLKVANGEFKPICNLNTDDYGAKLRNVYFVADNNYAEFFDGILSNIMVGAYLRISDNKLSDTLEIIEDDILEQFGYLMNVYNIDKKISKAMVFLKKICKNN